MVDRWTLWHSIVCLTLLPVFLLVHDSLLFLGIGAACLVAIALSFYVFCFKDRATPFTLADSVTLLRIWLAMGLLPVFWLEASTGWISFAIAAAAAVTDLWDGWLARRHGPTARGAKLDMEADAFLMLMLSLCAYRFGDVLFVVLIPGLMRYVFVIFESVKGRATEPAQSSLRAKVLCAATVVLLVASLAPMFPGLVKGLLALTSAGLIAYSFSFDFRSLKWA